MNVTVIAEDNLIIVDGEPLYFDFPLDSNIWSIRWDGVKGEIEYKDNTPNADIEDFSGYQNLVDAHAVEKQRIINEEAQALASRTYAEKRASSYPSVGDQLDSLFHAGAFPTDMADKIQAVKDAFPK